MAASTIQDDTLRDDLGALLQSGLPTEWEDRAFTGEAVNAVVARLQVLERDDHAGKLQAAGFTAQPYVPSGDDTTHACETCMYYAVHRRFCDLPELQLPVRAEWSCRLWRI